MASSQEKHWARLENEVSTQPGAVWECLALLGTDARSLSKLYVRREGARRWYALDKNLSTQQHDPMEYQSSLPPTERLPDDRMVRGDLAKLEGLVCPPDMPALARGLALFQKMVAASM